MARKQLNKTMVVGLTLCLFAFMVLLSVVMLRQLQRRDPKYFVDLAETALEHEEWQQASLFYKEAWQRSQDAIYLVRLGDTLLRGGDVTNAVIAWRQALVNQPDLMAAHRSQLDVLLELARMHDALPAWRRVRESAEVFLGTIGEDETEHAAFARHALGLALVKLDAVEDGNRARGVGELEHAIDLAPDEIDYAVDLVQTHLAEGDTKEADHIVAQLLKRHDQPGRSGAVVRLLAAQLHASKQSMDEAQRWFHESIRFAEGNGEALQDARLGYAAFLARRWAIAKRQGDEDASTKRFDEAESLLKQCVTTVPDDYHAYVQLAVIYKAAERHNDVVAVCEQRLSRGLSRKGIEAARNRVYTFRLMILASEACVAVAVADEQSGDHERREEWLDRAQQHAIDAKGESPNHPRVLSQIGRVKLARGDFRAALEDLRAADEAYRTYDTVNWEHKIILARVHLRLNEAGAARSVLEEVLDQARRKRANDPLFWTVYAQTLIDSYELEQARSIIDRVLLIAPQYADARRLKAAVYERLGRPGAAGRLIEEITGDAVVRALLSARQVALDEDTDRALDVLREALSEHPGDVRLVSAIASELVNRNRHEEANAIVANALSAMPDDMQLKKLAVLTRPGLDRQERDRQLQSLIEAEPDGYKRDLDLVSLHLRNRNLDETLAAIDRAQRHLVDKDTPMAQAATAVQHHALLKAKVRVASNLKDDAALDAARSAAQTYNVDGVGGKTILGLVHMAREELDQAIAAFREAIAAQPTDAWSLTHLGQCLHRRGRFDDARQAYLRAVRITPNNGLAHKGLALLARRRGDAEAFDEHYAICLRVIPGDPWIEGESRARKEEAEPADAIRRREADLTKDPDNVDNLLRLADLCEKVGEQDKADTYFNRAMALRPDDVTVAETAARYFRRSGRSERALQLLLDFAGDPSTDEERAGVQLLVARHHLAVGDVAQAEATLLRAVELAETESSVQALAEFYLKTTQQLDRALPWLDKSIAIGRSSGSPRLAVALQARIACLLHPSLNDAERTAQAGRDVAELKERFPDDPRARVWESQVRARSGNIDAAVIALSDYLNDRPGEPYALYQRAQHMITQGRLSLAIDDLESIRRYDPLALEFKPRRLLAQLYRRTGRTDRWMHELESLASDAPDSPDIFEALISAYLHQDRTQEADRLVTARINRADGGSEAQWLFLRGRVSIEMGDLSKALADFQRGATLNEYAADTMAEVMDVYIRIGRFAEGLDYYDRHATKDHTSPILRSRYGVLLARSRRLAEAADAFRGAMAQATAEPTDWVRAISGELHRAYPSRAAISDAIPLFEKPSGLDRLDRAGDRILVRLYRTQKQFDSATKRLDRLIDSAPDDRERGELIHEKADIAHAAGRPNQARSLYEDALKYDADNWVTLNNLAYLLSDEIGEDQAALPYARRAVAIVDSASVLDTLGWIYVGLGDYTAAVAELSRALRHDPDAALTMYHLGEAYRQNGQYTEAIDIFESALTPARAQHDDTLSRDIERSIHRARNRQDRR